MKKILQKFTLVRNVNQNHKSVSSYQLSIFMRKRWTAKLQEEHHSPCLKVSWIISLKGSPVNSVVFLATGFRFILDLWSYPGATESEILLNSPLSFLCTAIDGQTHTLSLEYSLKILNWWRK